MKKSSTIKKSELIIWRCETRDDLKRKHPKWTNAQIDYQLDRIQEQLFGNVKVEG